MQTRQFKLCIDINMKNSRPGRPPKRTQSVTSPENSHIMPHSVPGLMSPGIIPPTAATNAAIAEAMKVKKIKLEAMSNYHANNNQHGADSENGDLNSSVGNSDGSWDKEKLQSPPTQGSQASVNHPNLPGQHNVPVSHPLNPLQQNHLLPNGLELPFMMMPHPLIPVSLPPASVTMAMSQMNHLSTIANMAAAAQVQSPPSRVETSVIKVTILKKNKNKTTKNNHTKFYAQVEAFSCRIHSFLIFPISYSVVEWQHSSRYQGRNYSFLKLE
uniref:Dachshund family transcription factor 1 n=1 Tax=Accipiter nisus TaxID=211598 RepID=A0A8B9M4F3_9AVES